MDASKTQVFTKISPDELELSLGQRACSVAVFKDSLYLAEVHAGLDASRDRHFLRVARYNPQVAGWEECYSAFLSSENSQADQFLESEMVVFPGQGEVPETLYLRLGFPSGGQLLRSEEGERFQVVDPLPVGVSDLLFSRRFRQFQGRLYTLPVLSLADEELEVEDPCLIHVATPFGKEPWLEANAPGFGDASNREISELVAFNGCLYAGTVNLERGCQIWKAEAQPTLPHAWQSLLSQGAGRYSLNQWVSHLVPFKGDLYAASGLYLDRSQEQPNPYYPAGFEILRLYPQGGWDVIVGTPKFTREGLKVPLSAMGPGFDDPYNCAVEFLTAHGDSLYLGTQNLDRFQLWHSEDGEIWQPLALGDEFSSSYPVEVLGSFSTSWGLVLALDCPQLNGTQNLQIWSVGS